MINTSDYRENRVYGTLQKKKISATTLVNSDYLLININITINTEVYDLDFEVPFYQNKASLYVENYFHSILTQLFDNPIFSENAINHYSYDLADVIVTLTELKDNIQQDQKTITFKVMLGDNFPISHVDITDFTTGSRIDVLESFNAEILPLQGYVSVSFFSKELPAKYKITNALGTTSFDFTTTSTTKLVHNVIIPASFLFLNDSRSAELELVFSTETINVGKFFCSNSPLEHNAMLFQNKSGTLSVFDFLGSKTSYENFNFKADTHTVDYLVSSEISSIKFQNLFKINTGYILDSQKHEALKDLLRSFNIYTTETKKMLVYKPTKLIPYSTNKHDIQHTINFKLAENDLFHIRGF